MNTNILVMHWRGKYIFMHSNMLLYVSTYELFHLLTNKKKTRIKQRTVYLFALLCPLWRLEYLYSCLVYRFCVFGDFPLVTAINDQLD